MFTGIIEGLGKVEAIERNGTNVDLWLSAPFASELKVDQSVAHDGVCLTVVECSKDKYRVTAIQETLDRTNFSNLSVGSKVNLERCMPAHGRFDGHIVQGHVDQTATLIKVDEVDGSWNFYFKFNAPEHALVVAKGSITVNGVSLTVVDAGQTHFSVSIIPYTYAHTTFHALRSGDHVNIEFDILGKYVLEAQKRLLSER
jgi:riboflavin synthase